MVRFIGGTFRALGINGDPGINRRVAAATIYTRHTWM